MFVFESAAASWIRRKQGHSADLRRDVGFEYS